MNQLKSRDEGFKSVNALSNCAAAVTDKISLRARVVLLVAVIAPFLGLVAAIASLWGWGFRWTDLILLLSMYMLTVLGITVGFHRLFTHRAFETNRAVQVTFAILGSMAVQGPLLQWVALHRRHHQHSDESEDPHSPHHQGSGVLGMLRGLWHAHLGWMFQPKPANLRHYVKDLNQIKVLRAVSSLFPLWVAVGLLIPAALGWLLVGSIGGAWNGFIWGGLVRILFVHHVTWSINSVCHIWGQQPYRSNDESRNNAFFGIFGLGEGWHNTHHAFPTSARHGLRWWQIDVSYWVIRLLEVLHLAWNVKVPSSGTISRNSA
ncbi:Fatty acid desaturase [Anatilimnocola aggregata]|uniref:Fatty acid desaturase n=1 Tax=Anatilimnocola aggregata TaxID=2528021 RepID=A0A517Y536_9BACT|nr:acyl-CoA desaturase [Anatilimnocola aggregata]QDU25310.1 Fatty acid desaturase [Anatilimnocola aggregata]